VRNDGTRYLLITPCRDEAKYARRTLDSIVRQTLRPALWIIVDDGSTDDTPPILHEYAAQHDFIRVIRREDRGRRSVGPGVVDAFYAGYDTIDPNDFDFVCKLDLDLDIPAGYFQTLIDRMAADPRIGTCSGKPYYRGICDKLVSECCGDEMSVGMIKFYRLECFLQIGGFVREVMWDGIDCHRCRMFGWIAVSWDEPGLRFEHLRAMGSSQRGILTGRARHGFGQYFMGTGPAYMASSAFFRMSKRPIILGGLAMGWGYLWSLLSPTQRYDDAEFRRFLRRYQWNCLLHGKARATRSLDEQQERVWQELAPARSALVAKARVASHVVESHDRGDLSETDLAMGAA
jgi:hypothetical protein